MGLSVGSLFSGIGGFDLGLERAGFSVKWQVEIDAYCNRVLAKHWPAVTRYGDIKSIDWTAAEPVDLVCGGFPCQPFSVAGKRRGQDDDRYLWPEVVRCLDALRPTWFVGENVPGLIKMALDQVCADLESLGYTVWPVCLPACAVDASHVRQRVWILAHTESKRTMPVQFTGRPHSLEQGREIVADSNGAGLSRSTCSRLSDISGASDSSSWSELSGNASAPWRDWPTEPSVGRVANGIPGRVDRIRGLGNAIVPQIAEEIGRMIHTIHAKEHAT